MSDSTIIYGNQTGRLYRCECNGVVTIVRHDSASDAALVVAGNRCQRASVQDVETGIVLTFDIIRSTQFRANLVDVTKPVAGKWIGASDKYTRSCGGSVVAVVEQTASGIWHWCTDSEAGGESLWMRALAAANEALVRDGFSLAT